MFTKQETLLSYALLLFILTMCGVAYIKWQLASLKMGQATYLSAGMMEYVNPKDGKVLYIPVYQRVK